jgi:chromosome segregation ATPase
LFLCFFVSFLLWYYLTSEHRKTAMRPPEINNEDIVKAGKELLASGRNVTGFALRQRVGGGSAPRLKQVWDEYLSSQSGAVVEQITELPIELEEQLKTVSVALVERLRLLASELNVHAVKASERRVSEVVRAAGEQRAQAERELADASTTVDDLEAKLETAAGEVQNLTTKLTHCAEVLQRQAVELAQLKERLLAADTTVKNSEVRYETEHTRANEARDKASRFEGQVEALEKLFATRQGPALP